MAVTAKPQPVWPLKQAMLCELLLFYGTDLKRTCLALWEEASLRGNPTEQTHRALVLFDHHEKTPVVTWSYRETAGVQTIGETHCTPAQRKQITLLGEQPRPALSISQLALGVRRPAAQAAEAGPSRQQICNNKQFVTSSP